MPPFVHSVGYLTVQYCILSEKGKLTQLNPFATLADLANNQIPNVMTHCTPAHAAIV